MKEHCYFRTADGQVVRSLAELVPALEQMSDDTFHHHVNEAKNDFLNWIKDIYQDFEFCARLEGIADRLALKAFIEKNINDISLVINAGSSSLKFCLFDGEGCLLKGHIDAIGNRKQGRSILERDGEIIEHRLTVSNHTEAIQVALDGLLESGVIKDFSEILRVGHRVVHGGEYFKETTLIDDDDVVETIASLSDLAPLHNPPALAGIEMARDMINTAVHYAIFDTAFHQTIPDQAFLYGLPYELYQNNKIRKYGFHGINHKYMALRAEAILDKKIGEMITCHLGNGSSITAIKDGLSVDTSMGFTPLDGLIMGTRSGDIDPEIIIYLLKTKKYNLDELDDLLNKQSGLQGITHLSSDVRDLYDAAKTGNKMAQLALDMLSYKIAFFIGGYMTILHGLECIVFSGGIGENAWYIREKVLDALQFINCDIDQAKNRNNETIINSPYSQINVLVVPANEEIQIIREMREVEGSR